MSVLHPSSFREAGLKDAGYVVYQILAQNWGLSGTVVVRIYAAILTVASIAACVVWIESPIRAMFSELPEGAFPKYITKKERRWNFKECFMDSMCNSYLNDSCSTCRIKISRWLI